MCMYVDVYACIVMYICVGMCVVWVHSFAVTYKWYMGSGVGCTVGAYIGVRTAVSPVTMKPFYSTLNLNIGLFVIGFKL